MLSPAFIITLHLGAIKIEQEKTILRKEVHNSDLTKLTACANARKPTAYGTKLHRNLIKKYEEF